MRSAGWRVRFTFVVLSTTVGWIALRFGVHIVSHRITCNDFGLAGYLDLKPK